MRGVCFNVHPADPFRGHCGIVGSILWHSSWPGSTCSGKVGTIVVTCLCPMVFLVHNLPQLIGIMFYPAYYLSCCDITYAIDKNQVI